MPDMTPEEANQVRARARGIEYAKQVAAKNRYRISYAPWAILGIILMVFSFVFVKAIGYKSPVEYDPYVDARPD